MALYKFTYLLTLRDGDVFLFICSSVCLFVCLSPETRTCRALAWLAQQRKCWQPWAAKAPLDEFGSHLRALL